MGWTVQMIQVVVPTYNRPHLIKRQYDELMATPKAKPLFVIHQTDTVSRKVVQDLGADYVIDIRPPSGVNASNTGVQAATSDFIVLSQDDTTYHENWLREAINTQEHTRAMVVGLNDGFYGRDISEHSVCWLIDRKYLEASGLATGVKNVAFFPGYVKNYADNELNETMKYRGLWAYAKESFVEHLHPGQGKAPLDATYTEPEQFAQKDLELYNSRKHLWGK